METAGQVLRCVRRWRWLGGAAAAPAGRQGRDDLRLSNIWRALSLATQPNW
jgi:hypothetical protein